jgi:hypothetical protein
MAILVDIELVRQDPIRVTYRYDTNRPRGSWGEIVVSANFDPTGPLCEILEWTPAPGEGQNQFFAQRANRKVFMIRRDTGEWPKKAMWAS